MPRSGCSRSGQWRPDKRVELGTFNQFFTLAGLFYLTLIPVLLGTVLFVVPRLLLMTIRFFASFLIVDREEGVFSSLSLSQQLVTRSGFGNYVLLVIIVFAISIAPSAIPYVGFVLGWFLTHHERKSPNTMWPGHVRSAPGLGVPTDASSGQTNSERFPGSGGDEREINIGLHDRG